MCVWGTIEARSRSHCCCEKSISITYAVGLSLALVIQRTLRMRHIVICGLRGSTIFFYIISYTARFSGKSYWIKNVSWLSLQSLSEIMLNVRRNERNVIINVHRSSCKVPINLVRFKQNLNFLDTTWKILKYQISWKSVEWEPSCSCRRTRGQTDTHGEANRRFLQFFKAHSAR